MTISVKNVSSLLSFGRKALVPMLSGVAGCNLVPAFEAYVIECSENEDEDICYTDQFCEKYSLASRCAFHWKGIDKVNDESIYPQAKKGGPCDPNMPPPVAAYSPCYAINHPYPNTSNPDTSMGGTSTTGEPTTGEPTTGGEQKDFICTQAPADKYFYYRYGTETEAEAIALGSLRSESWGVAADLPNVYCAYGTEADAINACQTKCKMDWETRVDGLGGTKAYIWGVSDEWGPDSSLNLYSQGGPGDCDLLEYEVVERVAPYTCLGQGAIFPAWDGFTPMKKFLATAMFTGTDGGNTSQVDIRGYLAMKVENCGSTSCDLIIDALETSAQSSTGIYTSPTGAQSSYSIDGAEIRLTQPLVGQWHMARGSVVFPTSVAVGKLWNRSATINGSSISGDVSLFEVDQIAGTYRSGVLSLSFTQPQGSSVMVVTLTTQ